jgi:dipeptidase E
MGKLVAIAGGEIGRLGTKVETTKIDQEVIRLSGKVHPKVLFIPTASGDPQGYIDVFVNHYEKRLGCKVNSLLLISEKPTKNEIEKKIFDADVIYVGGGNTLMMLKVWRKFGVDRLLMKAFEKGIVLSGLSAGANCWFKNSVSDSRLFKSSGKKGEKKDRSMMLLKGMDMFNITFSPHQTRESFRLFDLMNLIKKTSGIGIAVDDCAAFEILDDTWRIIHSKTEASGFKVYKKNSRVYCDKIFASNEFKPMVELFSKAIN